MMNKKQAMSVWNVTRREVHEICEYYGIKKEEGQYSIPEDTVPIYIPDKRYLKQDLRVYIFVADAICRKLQIAPELFNSSDEEIKTVVRVMRNEELIVLLEGRQETSLDYRDYMPGIKLSAWKREERNRLKLLKDIMNGIVEAAAKGAVSAMLEP